MTTDTETIAAAERAGLSASFKLMAAAREFEGNTSGDARFTAAADSIRRIIETLDQIDVATFAKFSNVNEMSDGLLSKLIAARLEQIGFALPLYEDALSFMQSIRQQVDVILHNARHPFGTPNG